MAESWEEKAELIKEEAFLKPLKSVERKAQEKGGEMWKRITEEDIREVLFNQSVSNAPGPDRLGYEAMRLLWKWDSRRIIAIVKMSFRLRSSEGSQGGGYTETEYARLWSHQSI